MLKKWDNYTNLFSGTQFTFYLLPVLPNLPSKVIWNPIYLAHYDIIYACA